MKNSANEIANLLYRYAELMDEGNLEAASELFRHAQIKSQGGLINHKQLLDQWRRVVKIYPCGTPRTRHLVTNPIIELDENALSATCRSCYTVLQCADGFPLQVIAAGRYHDTFRCEQESGALFIETTHCWITRVILATISQSSFRTDPPLTGFEQKVRPMALDVIRPLSATRPIRPAPIPAAPTIPPAWRLLHANVAVTGQPAVTAAGD